jgi:alkanesulfonate monooxygenase SsuD/methylene tetrahydromethanopterin reductase-like flavin-dependent oxidoreductase (luciferase family)
MTPAAVQVGVSVHDSLMMAGAQRRRDLTGLIEQAGLDYLSLGDHVSFHDGTGFDGLIAATAALSASDRLPVLVGVYLLGLRHPLLAARQLASISQLAPGRLILGAGAGGEDRNEISNSGVDPATRGRRLDECLQVLRALAGGSVGGQHPARTRPAGADRGRRQGRGRGPADRQVRRRVAGYLLLRPPVRPDAGADHRRRRGSRPRGSGLVRHQHLVRAGCRRGAGQAAACRPAGGAVPDPVR